MIASLPEIYLAVPTNRMEETVKFYVDVLGMARDKSNDDLDSIALIVGVQRLFLLRQAGELRACNPNLSLQVHGFPSLVDHFFELGILTSRAAQNAARQLGRFEIADPAGNIVTLVQATDSERHGRALSERALW